MNGATLAEIAAVLGHIVQGMPVCLARTQARVSSGLTDRYLQASRTNREKRPHNEKGICEHE